MKKIKLLIPILGFTSLSTVAMPLASCGNTGGGGGGEETGDFKVTKNIEHGTITYTILKLNTSFTITYTPDTDYEMSSVTIKIGDNTLTQGTDFTISGNTITVNASVVTSKTIVITITAQQIQSGDVKVITTDTTLTAGSFKSTSADQNSVLVNGNKITANLSNLTIGKTGDSSKGDETSFYGINSGLLAKGGSTVKLDKLNVTTNAVGANGVFAYGGKSSTKSGETGDGTNITISNSTINTSKDNSGGVMVAGHGSLTANNCTVTTQGDSSAPIRSDRGGDTMSITGGTYTSNGKGSPAIYATATITATNATLKSNHSEGVIVEGSNFVTLTNCDLEDTNDKLNGQSTTYKNIFLYQSMSGDAGSGGDGITITGGTIKTHKGDDFYVTNQTSVINLNGVAITNDSTDTHYFLRAQKDAWGEKEAEKGGKVTLNATQQTINGNIYIDSISTLSLNLKNDSEWTGCLTTDAKSTTGVVVSIDSASSWTLSADSYVGKMADTTSLSRVNVNGHKLYGWNGSDWAVIKQ